MIALVQRVKGARLSVVESTGSIQERGNIGLGVVVYLGVEQDDTDKDAESLAIKISALRIFEDTQGKINFSVKDKGRGVLCVPNFTLCAETSEGNRPSFEKAKNKNDARRLFDLFVIKLTRQVTPVISGVFGAQMRIAQVNDGPVNIILKTK